MTAQQSWFVYYKVPSASCADMTRRARLVAGALASWVSVAPRVLRKVDEATVTTLMETYEGVADPQGFAAAMADAVAAAGFPQELVATRRIERFAPAE